MIKILATTDWHIGNIFHGYDRLPEHEAYLQWLLQVIEGKQPDALLVCGDIFDNSNPSAASQELYYNFLDTLNLHFPHLQTLIIAGNHDSAARLEAPRQMLARHRIQVRGLIRQIDGKAQYSDLIVPIKNASGESAYVLTVPYLRDSDYVRGQGYGAGVNRFLQELIAEANKERKAGEALLLMAHLYATGSEIAENSSERIVIGGSEMVNMEALDASVTLALLGHLHRRQCVNGNNHIRYPGSALPMSFTERDYRHGAEYIELENGALTGEPEFVEFTSSNRLLSIPDKPAGEEEIMRLLEELPDKADAVECPYLEINVLLEFPDPAINVRLSKALEKKSVRLCAVKPYYKSTWNADEEELIVESVEDLLTKNPIEVIRKSYLNRYKCEMREELVVLAERAVEAAKQEER